ncbi:MAG: BatD family protein, partial [Bacteroidales bacterium]
MKSTESLVKIIYLKGVFLFTLFFAVISVATAQISFTAEVPRVVEVGESFRLVFTTNGKPSSFNPPSITGLNVLAGPTSSTMSSTQIVNGKRTESFQVSYTYILQSQSEGKYTIPAASVIVDGKSYSSSAVTIEVVKTDSSKPTDTKGKESATLSNEDIFVKISISKGRVVTGEHFIATIKLYTRVPVAGFEDVK